MILLAVRHAGQAGVNELCCVNWNAVALFRKIGMIVGPRRCSAPESAGGPIRPIRNVHFGVPSDSQRLFRTPPRLGTV